MDSSYVDIFTCGIHVKGERRLIEMKVNLSEIYAVIAANENPHIVGRKYKHDYS